ncbi:MAG: hypothetical protein HC852_01835 [Acaryochloridaceae cyanobacterium RU_4_10]|nr:hypothetical protein [Acaryochloridaceae cyanobacterium RU_4_10]
MADVTAIRSIANNLLNPITLIDGENKSFIITIESEGGWNGNIWVPWVEDEDSMWKCITFLGIPKTEKLFLFQDYLKPANKDAVKYCTDGKYASGVEVKGSNQGGGDKVLIFGQDGTLTISN